MHLEILTEKPVSAARSTPILFVHGMWHAAWCWEEHFLPYFAQHGYASNALSLRGHGESEGHEGLRWTSLNDYVADVAQVIGQMKILPVLVGHSMGGMIVQKYLESNAAPAAVLLASAPPTGVLAATLRVALRHPLAFLKAGLTLSMFQVIGTPRLAQDALFSDDMPIEKMRRYASRLQNESFRAYLDMTALSLPHPTLVKMPILVVGAADDRFISIPELQATGLAYRTQAEVLPHMAHDMMLEARWREAADLILDWLNKQGL
jgi:alpha-beta hydrolase superfamily lysophospholipase